jgi:plastocyanin
VKPFAPPSVSAVAGILLLACVMTACGSTSGHASPRVKSAYVYMVNTSGSNPYAFSPHQLVISAGTRVTWINRTSQPHTVSQTGEHPFFDSGSLRSIDPHQRWSFVFRRVGRFGYSCLIHPFMHGIIVVRA